MGKFAKEILFTVRNNKFLIKSYGLNLIWSINEGSVWNKSTWTQICAGDNF